MAVTVNVIHTSAMNLGDSLRSRSDAVMVASLSPREQEILRLVAEGCRDREMAERLYLSHHTVANHVRNILAKLEVQSRAAAIGLAVRSGLI